jgi:peptidoglycan/LPS O-acetylase OafA/YrhL
MANVPGLHAKIVRAARADVQPQTRNEPFDLFQELTVNRCVWITNEGAGNLNTQSPGYRTDIDGLRAVAVLLVILYHYGVPGFAGGFVGVDVFFVISGFLIAAHIAADIRAGRFSLLAFYERRIRRILPALFAMYALALLAGALVLFPPDLHFLSRVGAYVIPFLANYPLYRNAGAYGGEFADHVVLLHTWSLAVEEQFYMFFPLLMLAIASFCRARYAAVLWPLALVSLLACIIAIRISPLVAFYLAPFRAWELLAGALLAVGSFAPPRARYLRTGAAVLGLLLLAAADLLLTTADPYPSEMTLIPCVGTVLVLYAGCDHSEVVGRLLGGSIMRRIGLWSYSLYLYHWPLLLLEQYYAFDPLSTAMRWAMLVATFLLGALSWRYVEQPFRGPHALLQRRTLFATAVVSGAVLSVATFAIYRATEPQRYTTQERIHFPGDSADQARCRGASPEVGGRPFCILGDKTAPVDTVLWGDSHALAMLPAVDMAFARHHEAAMFAQRGGCPPLMGVYVRDQVSGESSALRPWLDAAGVGRGAQCTRHNDAVLAWIVQHRIRTVILAGHWIAYTGDHFLRRLTDAQSPDNDSLQENAAVFARGLERLLSVLQHQHVRVFLLEDVPHNALNVPYELASARRLDLPRDFRISRTAYEAQELSATQIFQRIQQRYGVHILRPQDILCAGGPCAIARGEAPLYNDDEHLSPLGAVIVEPALDAVFTDNSW